MKVRMKRFILILLLLLLTAGCVGGGSGGGSVDSSPPPPIPTPTLTPVPQPFRTGTTFVGNVLSVDVRYHDGRTRTLDTDRHRDGSWARFLPRPLQPGHSSREWLLTENHYDGRILLYAVVSWNDADPADYLAAGWWLVYPPDVPFWEFESATRGVFIDGPELDPSNPPELPLTGTATYVGGAGGAYTYNYGRNWGEFAGSSEYTEFVGSISLTADFGSKRLTGCMGCLEPIDIDPGRHLYPIVTWRNPGPEASPADYDLHFSASFDAKGAFKDTEITVTHPERTITQTAGTWRGQFSNVPDADGNPRRLVGSSDVHFAEEDGSSGRFTGIFDALTPAALKLDDGNAGNAN